MAKRIIKRTSQSEEFMRQEERAKWGRPSKCDPTGAILSACADIARANGKDVTDIYEECLERAAVREYCGGLTRSESERLALEDVAGRFR